MRTVGVSGEYGQPIGTVQVLLSENKRFVKLRIATALGYFGLALDADELDQVVAALTEAKAEMVE